MTTPVVDPRGDEVHVWWAALDVPRWRAAVLERTLGADERLRADRYRFESDRRRFVVRRGLLRLLLARYVGCDPIDVGLRYGHAGKPELESPGVDADLRFNASHARDLALVAIARGRRVGVDVEALRPLSDLDGVARACSSPREHAALRALPPGRRTDAFLALWTRKEAFVKATGDGLAFAPERVEVSVDPDEPACLRAVDGCRRAAAAWSLRPLPTGRGYVGAVVVEGPLGRLVWRDVDVDHDHRHRGRDESSRTARVRAQQHSATPLELSRPDSLLDALEAHARR